MNEHEKQELVRKHTRKNGKKLQIREQREIGNYVVWTSIEQMVREVLPYIDGLVDWAIEMEVDYGSYGDRDKDVLVVNGWRDATKAEVEIITEHQAQKEADAEARRRAEQERLAEQLRKERPDLFPTTFVEP